MAKPADLSKVFDELQAEADATAKRKEALEQECATLEAKRLFLNDAIGRLEQVKATSEQDYKDKAVVYAERLADDKQLLEASKKEHDTLRTERVQLESDLSSLNEKLVRETELAKQAIQDKQQELVSVVTEITATRDRLFSVQEELRSSRKAAEVLDNTVAAKNVEVTTEIAKLEVDAEIVRKRHRDLVSHLDTKQDELEQLEERITERKKAFDDYATKHKEFQDYEKRSTATLQAREAAILDKEKQLGAELSKAARRNSILDNAH